MIMKRDVSLRFQISMKISFIDVRESKCIKLTLETDRLVGLFSFPEYLCAAVLSHI